MAPCAAGCGCVDGVPRAAVVLCDCSTAGPAQRAFVVETAAQLAVAGRKTLRVADLCGAVGRRDPSLAAFAARRPLLVLACRQRAVRALFRAAGLDDLKPEVIDLRQGLDAARAALAARLDNLAPGELTGIRPQDGWLPWFPVVDEERCQRCGQCASFCVFGVYAARSDGGVDVVRPDGCKTNCPACARVCPSAAIIFPKHDEAPFDGSEIRDEDAVAALTRDYTRQLLGSDPYAALAERRRKAALLRRPAPTAQETAR